MDYKKLYVEVIKNLCLRDKDEFENIVEQERPEFQDKLIPNDQAPYGCLFSMKLDEQIANEKDYRDFCEFIYSYIGVDFDTIVNDKKFNKFKKEN